MIIIGIVRCDIIYHYYYFFLLKLYCGKKLDKNLNFRMSVTSGLKSVIDAAPLFLFHELKAYIYSRTYLFKTY